MEILFNQFLHYLEIEKGYSKRTIKEYKYDLAIFFKFLDKDILETSKIDVRNFLSELKTERNYTISASSRKLATLRSFFKFCVLEQYILRNPLDYIATPKPRQRLPVFLTNDEVNKLINKSYSYIFTTKGKRNYAIVMLLLSTGLRISELTNLSTRDIEFCGNGFSIKVKGKGDKERIIPIMNKAKDAVYMWLTERPSCDYDSLFINTAALTPLSKISIQRMVKTLGKEAGINKKVTPHILRHTFATNLMKNNANILSIQELLGHANLNTTRIYTHLGMQDIQNAVAMLSYN